MVATAIRKMMVRPTSRMVSAISFGVFCRSAPSTKRDHPVEEALARLLGDADLDPVGNDARARGHRRAVAARLADDRRASPVIAASLTEATPSITSPSAGMRSPVSTRTISPARSCEAGDLSQVSPTPSSRLAHELRLGVAQRCRLRLAAPFGERLGEIAEQDGEPEPEDELDLEAEAVPCHAGRPSRR